ncbi:MAG: hypothetical protein JXA33_03780 [Anaerolineae bacterium]|nr:hypothetical protein [Anaerolineae bacterium]
MEDKRVPSAQLARWVTAIREYGLVDVALPFLDVLQVWGFVGGQVLWMLAPFFGERLAPLAEALEQPEILRQLEDDLRAGEVQ